MRRIDRLARLAVGTLLISAIGLAQPSPGAAPSPEQRLAAIKQSLAQSQQALRSYEWIETTAVSVKGEEKSRKQNRCYYGADGVLQKVPIASTPPPAQKRGLRGAIVASKTEEMTDYLKQAVALVKSYVPPDPALIQRSKDAGKMSLDILQPGKVVRLVFRDYRMPGDVLGLTLDMTSNKLAGMNVGSYIGQPSDAVTLDVTFGLLNDGTVYPAQVVLNAKAKSVTVSVINSGYKKNG